MASTIDQVKKEIDALPKEDRLRLVSHIVESVLDSPKEKPHRPLKYGEFRGPNMSTEEDFKIAEWRFEDQNFEDE
jgi:hypothetical protein